MAALLGLVGCTDDDSPDPGEPTPPEAPGSIADAASAEPSLSTLVAAVEFASDDNDLVTMFAAPGALTLFAPTNIAFDSLAVEITGDQNARGIDLLKPENRPLVRSVLLYHVLTAKVLVADIPVGRAITPAEGGFFKIEASPELFIQDGRNRTSRITQTDIEVGNGVIHLIDKVILPANKTIVETAQSFAGGNPPEFTLLVQAAIAADLVPTLNGAGPFTVFAPTDAAFAALLAELGVTPAQLLADKALLTQVLTYHVVPSRVLKAEVPIGAAITTVESGTFTVDASLRITDERGRVSQIVATDVFAKNGVIHVIDRVLLPAAPAPSQPTILALAQATPSLSTLVAAVAFASTNNDLVDLLAKPGTLTVFAPTNAAFDALAVELTGNAGAKGADLLTSANKPLLRSVLAYHVLASEVKAADIPFGKAITTAQGGIFKIDAGTPPVITDGRNRKSRITATDLDASNGVVHVIDRVILPANKNIVETAQALAAANPGEFKILVEAVVAANLAGTLSAPGPFTVFAPTDAAFAALLSELHITKHQLLANKALLTRVLTYHVVPGLVLKADVPVGAPITTVETGTFTVDSSLRITDERNRKTRIVATDVLTSNGVIHVLDRVLLPH